MFQFDQSIRLFLLPSLLCLASISSFGSSKDLKVFKRGKIELIDETANQVGHSKGDDYSRDFEEDVMKMAEFGDVYDEQLAPLPRFELHKNGKNMGWTKLPIVTRKKSWWSTPSPRARPGENPPFTYTPWLQTITRAPSLQEEQIEVETLPPESSTTKRTRKPPPPRTTTTAVPSTVASTMAPPSSLRTRRPFVAKTTIIVPAVEETSASTLPPFQKAPKQPAFVPGNSLERLRKKLLTLRPSPPQHAEVTVKSNTFAIHPSATAVDPFAARRVPTTPPSRIPGGPIPANGMAWSRSWHIGPDGRMEVRSWDREHGERVEQRQLSSAERRKWLPGVGTTPSSIPSSTTRKVFKPALIQSQTHRHKGPTFECRVLDAAVDGQASASNDPTCPLDFPGIPSDGSCKCTYQVLARDERDCATGFIYTCTRKAANLDLAESPAAEEEAFARQLQ